MGEERAKYRVGRGRERCGEGKVGSQWGGER